MIIRRAKVEDADAIAKVHVSSWQSAYRGQLPEEFLASLSVEQRAESWRNAITDSPTLIGLCEDDGAIVGFVAYGRGRDEDARNNQIGEIYAIYLEETSWGNGHGKALLDSSLNWLKDEGFAGAILWVLDSNQRAIRFYERNGFAADGQAKTDELTAGVEVREVRYMHNFTAVP